MKKTVFLNNPQSKKVVTHPHLQTSNCEPSTLTVRRGHFIFLNIASWGVCFSMFLLHIPMVRTMVPGTNWGGPFFGPVFPTFWVKYVWNPHCRKIYILLHFIALAWQFIQNLHSVSSKKCQTEHKFWIKTTIVKRRWYTYPFSGDFFSCHKSFFLLLSVLC